MIELTCESVDMLKHKSIVLASLVGLGVSLTAHAVPPHKPSVDTNVGPFIGDLWSITAYDDSDPAHTQWATQNICFFATGTVGTHTAGIWYSTTFFDWNGTWRQEGDQVFMTGDYAGDLFGNAVGHDGIDWEIVTADKANEGYGHWKEWRENGRFGNVIGYANTKLKRIGACPYRLPASTTAAALGQDEIEKLILEESRKAPPRVRSDGAEVVGPMDSQIVPLSSSEVE